ncbi:MAG: hypothetical protein ACLTZT_14915 [Butyricimonas faecalis]
MMNTLKNKAEKSTSHLERCMRKNRCGFHDSFGKPYGLSGVEQMKVDFNPSQLHEEKPLCGSWR